MKVFLLLFLTITIAPPVLLAQIKPQPLKYGLKIFKNMEQIEFCIPFPTAEYHHPIKEERAKFLFSNKADTSYTATIQGLFRSNDTVSITTYFRNSYTPADEETGKVMVKKGLYKKTNCFYYLGYWSNAFYDSRFLEITWLRKEDVVHMVIYFPLKDLDRWMKRLKIITGYTSICK
jgi:hypothetical protein